MRELHSYRPFRPDFWRSLSLRNTLLLLITGTVFVLTVLILMTVLMVARRSADRLMEQDFRMTAGFLTQYLRERTDSMTAICEAMGSQPSIMAYLFGNDAGTARKHWMTVSDIADELAPRLRADSVTIIDQQGKIIGQSPLRPVPDRLPTAEAPPVRADRPWHGLILSEGLPAVAVNVPIFLPGQSYMGGRFYAVSHFDNQLAKRLYGSLGNHIAFVHEGRIVAGSVTLSRIPPIQEGAQNGIHTLSSSFYSDSGQRFIGTYQRIPIGEGTQTLGVLLLHPYNEAMALSTELESGLVLSFAFVLPIALILGIAVAKRLTAPLDSVVAAAQRIEDGEWPELLVVDRHDEIGLLQSAFNEMTDGIKSAQERLLARIDTDPLTSLDNHRRFKERLAQEVRRAIASDEPLSLLLLDIDRFHTLNEKCGMREGDRILTHIASLLVAESPVVAVPARYGGDEFALILPRMSLDEAYQVAQQIRVAARQPFDPPYSFSIGYASIGADTQEPETLLLAAEFALTQAKYLGENQDYRFDPSRITLSESVPSTAGEPVNTKHLYRFLRDGSLVAIQALAAAVDAKDHYTEGHSRRVADLAVLLAQEIGLVPEESDRIYTAAILHDVGKLGVPDQVLQKQGRLDPDELRMMQAHPVMGEIIVARVPQLAHTKAGIRWHHERWDGTGYPDGLLGSAIPLPARIIALADTFDAMTTDRPYQPGRMPQAVIQELEEQAGSQFDPELVPPFIAVLRRWINAKGGTVTALSDVQAGSPNEDYVPQAQ